MVEKTIKNMHVPAYCPIEVGVHDIEKRGVLVDVKNVMAIASIPIIGMPEEEVPVELGIDIPPIVTVGELDIGMVIDISMFVLAGTVLASRKHNDRLGDADARVEIAIWVSRMVRGGKVST
jgi:hypothetical protein